MFSHNPSYPSSTTALNLLRKACTEPYPGPPHGALQFELSVVENSLPTPDQFRIMSRFSDEPISDFLSAHPSVGDDDAEAVANLVRKTPGAMKWPIVVNWDKGVVSVGSLDGVRAMLQVMLEERDKK